MDMIKQLLGKISRKPSKSSQGDSNGDIGVNAYSSMNFCNGPISSNNSKPNSSSKSSNSVSGVARSSNGTLVSNSSSANKSNQGKKSAAVATPLWGSGVYETLPSFQDVPNARNEEERRK